MMTVRELLIEDFDIEMDSTRKMLESVPEAIPDYKPHPRSMPFSQLAGHIASLPAQAVRVIELDHFEVDMATIVRFLPKTRSELLERFEQNVSDARKALHNVSDEALWQTWTLKISGREIFALPRIKVLRKQILSHIIHHRAQLGVYLRLLEVKIPGSYGPSADDMGQFSAPAK